MVDPAIAMAERLGNFPAATSCEETRVFASGLLSQQIWCWGQDIKRSEGNWLLELGFHRTPPPKTEKNCASVYRLELPLGQRIVLRGFGVFFGDDQSGGVFVERYGFAPQFTERSQLLVDPWSCEDLPPMHPPSEEESIRCRLLTMALIEWLIGYEWRVRTQLGHDYRPMTLERWNNGKRFFLPAEHMMAGWRQLSLLIGSGRLCVELASKTSDSIAD